MVDINVALLKQQFVNEEQQFVSEYFPSETITAMGEEYYGFDLMEIRNIRIVVAEGKGTLNDLQVGIVYEFDQTVDIGVKYQVEDRASVIDNQPVYSDMSIGFECFQLNETTVLHATPDFMEELVHARNVSTPLTAMLGEAEAEESEILAVLAFEQIKNAYAEMVEANPIPQPLNVLNGAHRLLKSAEFRVMDHKMTLEMLSYDEKLALKLQVTVKRLIGLSRGLAAMLDQEGNEPITEALVAYIERVIELACKDLAPKQERAQVTMELHTDAAWASIVPFVFLMEAGFEVAPFAEEGNEDEASEEEEDKSDQ